MPAQDATAKINRWGLWASALTPDIDIHLEAIRRGGQWTKKSGEVCGMGMEFHVKSVQNLLWPQDKWHHWRELTLKAFCENRIISVLGPASSGKTYSAATFVLVMYYANPDRCSIVCTSTTREMLENRVWGEIKRKHNEARSRFPKLPGELIESRQRILSDPKKDSEDGRDFRNGLQGVPTLVGGSYRGLGPFVGIKNHIVILVADEASLLPRIFVDAISNLNKNQGFKGIALGNPLDTTDALGVIAEPSAQWGGWDGGIDQTGGTKTWPTRFNEGLAVQLVGSDCPNLKIPEGEPVPFPFLITRKAIEADIAFYGKDSIQFSSMNEGRMPRGLGNRRVLTRQQCIRFGALEEPIWKNTERTKILSLDAAYGGAGGDRCVLAELDFGPGVDPDGKDIQILALIDTMVVPVTIKNDLPPEDQIANFVKEQAEQRAVHPANFFFDSTGRGSLMGAFARIWSTAINGVEFGGKPSDRMVANQQIPAREYYSKRVTEIWWQLRLVVEARQFRGLTEDVMNELIMREWGLVSGNKIEVEPKSAMKLRCGRSPDLADCVVVGVEGALLRGFAVQQLSRQNPAKVNDLWKSDLKKKAVALRESWALR